MKKVLSIVLVLALALSMSTVAFAATKAKIDKDLGILTDGDEEVTWYDPAAFEGDTAIAIPGEVQDGKNSFTIPWNYEQLIELLNNPNEDAIEAVPAPGEDGRAAILKTWDQIVKNSKITPKFRATKGSQVIDDISVDGAGVLVEFVDPFKSNNTDGMDYEFKVYLIVDGKNWSAQSLDFEGNYINEVVDDYGSETDYFDYSFGVILKPSEFIREYEADFGNGVVASARGLKGAKYWGVSNQDVSNADYDVMTKYKSIDAVYHLSTLGMSNVINYITLEDVDSSAYIYDGDLKYLGRGNAKLAYAETYYVSNVELDVDDEDFDEPDDDDDDDDWDYDETPDLGGDDLYPSNPHDNPGTGK